MPFGDEDAMAGQSTVDEMEFGGGVEGNGLRRVEYGVHGKAAVTKLPELKIGAASCDRGDDLGAGRDSTNPLEPGGVKIARGVSHAIPRGLTLADVAGSAIP
jgi:hypothetical protein